MQHTFRLAVKRTSFLQTTAVSHRHVLASACRERHISTHRSSVIQKAAKSEQKLRPATSTSLDPLPDPPPPFKETPSIISTRDIGQYIEPLYSRGWGLTPILPDGNGIPVLRKRFEFTSADALQDFLADLREYEEKKQVRPSSQPHSHAPSSSCGLIAFPAPREDERIGGPTLRTRQYVDTRSEKAETGRRSQRRKDAGCDCTRYSPRVCSRAIV